MISGKEFEEKLKEKKLMGTFCKKCGEVHLPPRPICPKCKSPDVEWKELSGRGKLVAFTSIRVAPPLMIEEGYGRDKPYITGIVELEEGVKISARILGFDPEKPEDVKIGAPLVAHFHEKGERVFLAFKKTS